MGSLTQHVGALGVELETVDAFVTPGRQGRQWLDTGGERDSFSPLEHPTPLDSERSTGAMKFRPLQDRVLIKRIEDDAERTKGGLYIPDAAKEKPQKGKVIAVGKGRVSDDGKVTPLDVKAGDKVLFGKYSGSEIKLDGEEHLIMREEDILAVLEG
jgi:chaperonin GroES